MDGIFGDMFDMNQDGQLDAMELGMEYMLMNELTKDDDEKDESEEK